MKEVVEGGTKAAETGVKAASEGVKAVSNAVSSSADAIEKAGEASNAVDSAVQKLPKAKINSNFNSNNIDSDLPQLDSDNKGIQRDPFKNVKKYSSNSEDDSAVSALDKSKENRGEGKLNKAQQRLNDLSEDVENSKLVEEESDVPDGEEIVKNAGKRVGNAAKTVASDALDSAADTIGIVASAGTGNIPGVILSSLSLIGRNLKYIILSMLTFLLCCAIIVYLIFSPLLESLQRFDEIANNVTNILEKGNNFYTGFGYQSTKDAFYDELEYLYNEYDKQLDVPLLMSTLFYTDMTNGYSSDYGINLVNDEGDISELESGALKGAIISYLETKYNDVYSTLDEDGKNYTVGKIYRLRKLSRHQLDTPLFGLNLPTTSEEINLYDFIERSKGRLNDDVYQYLQTIAATPNPFVNATNTIHSLYSIIKGNETCETTNICNPTENQVAFTNLVKEIILSISSVSSVRYSISEGIFYVTVYKYQANEDNYKRYLKEYYIPKMPEFKYLIGNAEGDSKNKIIDDIINEIYSNVETFAKIFGYDLDADSESYNSVCAGGISRELANDKDKIGLPIIDKGFTYSFNGDYAYGIRDGVMHNGIDINSVTAGAKEGDDVLAIADGEVISSEPDVSCNTRSDPNCKKTAGAWVRIKHSITIDKKTYNFISVYMHMQTNSGQPKVGTKVKKGDKIGQIGNTGDSSGAHLHFEFRDENGTEYGQPLDPINLFINCSNDLIGNDVPEKIWFFLLSQGYTKEAAAAAMGNIQHESMGFKVDVIELGSGIGYGLCQWSFGRRTQLDIYAKSLGKDKSDLSAQLQFLVNELDQNGDRKYTNWQFAGHTDKYFIWKSASTVSDIDKATEAFCFGFERPDRAKAALSLRQQYAREIYEQYKDLRMPSSLNIGNDVNF